MSRSLLTGQKILLLTSLLCANAACADINATQCSISVDGKSFVLKGKYQVVDTFPDIKVQLVRSFPELKVLKVSSFPDDCGEWQEVSSFPDFTIQFVSSFPDLKIEYVESFPGLP
jgi:hypothetical protein